MLIEKSDFLTQEKRDYINIKLMDYYHKLDNKIFHNIFKTHFLEGAKHSIELSSNIILFTYNFYSIDEIIERIEKSKDEYVKERNEKLQQLKFYNFRQKIQLKEEIKGYQQSTVLAVNLLKLVYIKQLAVA